MQGMFFYRKAAVERAMKVQEVILRAMAKKITWWQAAEILGLSDRSMRRWRERYEEFGYDGLFDRRQGKPSLKRVPVALVEQALYRDRYFDLNVRHFHALPVLSSPAPSRPSGKRSCFAWSPTLAARKSDKSRAISTGHIMC